MYGITPALSLHLRTSHQSKYAHYWNHIETDSKFSTTNKALQWRQEFIWCKEFKFQRLHMVNIYKYIHVFLTASIQHTAFMYLTFVASEAKENKPKHCKRSQNTSSYRLRWKTINFCCRLLQMKLLMFSVSCDHWHQICQGVLSLKPVAKIFCQLGWAAGEVMSLTFRELQCQLSPWSIRHLSNTTDNECTPYQICSEDG